MIDTKRSFAPAVGGRKNNFDFLRFFFAALVVYGHSYSLLAVDVFQTDDLLLRISGGTTSAGLVAVNAFFVISGFLITMSWERSKGFGDYLRRRVLRIYPGFVVASLVSLLVFGPLCADSAARFFESLTWRHAVAPFTLKGVADVAPMHGATHSQLNGSLWTIKYEFLCYLVVAAVGAAGLLKRRAALLPITALFCVVAAFQSRYPGLDEAIRRIPGADNAASNLPRLLACFLTGMAFYVYRERIPRTREATLVAALVFGLSVVAVPLWPVLYPVMPLAFAHLIFTFAFTDRVRLERFAHRGDLSYGIYLYAWPVQQFLIIRAPFVWHPLGLFVAALALSSALAALSWHFVEKTFLKKKAKAAAAAEVEEVSPACHTRQSDAAAFAESQPSQG